MHPADLADIVEELGPAEREAIFETIDSEVAADALSEVEIPRCRPAFWNRWSPRRPPTSSKRWRPTRPPTSSPNWKRRPREEILEEMEYEPKTEVRELLEFEEDTAGGMMNTEYVALHENATVADAMRALKGNEDLLETLNTLFLVDAEERLTGAVPLARLFLARRQRRRCRSWPPRP